MFTVEIDIIDPETAKAEALKAGLTLKVVDFYAGALVAHLSGDEAKVRELLVAWGYEDENVTIL